MQLEESELGLASQVKNHATGSKNPADFTI